MKYKIQHWLWRLFKFTIHKRYYYGVHKPKEKTTVWAFTCFDTAYKCWYYDNRFHSLSTGKEVWGVRYFEEL